MALKFTVHTEGMDALREKLAQGCSKAEHILAQQIRADTDPFVPALTGSLANRTRIEGYTAGDYGPSGGNTIVYPGTAAHTRQRAERKWSLTATWYSTRRCIHKHKRIGLKRLRRKTLISGCV